VNAQVILTIQFAIGLVLLCSSVSKWLDPLDFARSIGNYQVLPPKLGYWFGLFVILVETWSATAHLTSWGLQIAVPATLALFASFALAIGVNLLRGRRPPCRCFGESDNETISGSTLLRLAILFVGEAALLGSHYSARITSVAPTQALGRDIQGFALLLAVLAVIATMWLLSLPDLVSVLRPCPRCGSQKEI